MLDPDRKAELLEWTKESLVPIRHLAEGKPVQREEVLDAVRQFIFVMGEIELGDSLPSPALAEAEDRAVTDDELMVMALYLTGLTAKPGDPPERRRTRERGGTWRGLTNWSREKSTSSWRR